MDVDLLSKIDGWRDFALDRFDALDELLDLEALLLVGRD